jgi:GAG-pre-integrase domain
MEGKRDKVLARRAKACDEKNKKKSEKGSLDKTITTSGPAASGIWRNKSGRAYIIDSISGQAILLVSAEDSAPSTALTAFENNPIYTSISDPDYFEYATLLIDDHSASVNWHKRRRTVTAGNCLVVFMNAYTCTTLFANAGPFILDSGATIHISPDPSNFFELKSVPPPQTIKGIGGSTIDATGIGKIRLQIGKGLEITLEPVLFVPEASIRLISVFVLGSGPQKLVSHFYGDGCWLTNSSGATMTSGKLSTMGKRFYTLNMGSPPVEHSFIAARVPDIETWHRHLGHINYKSIVDMSDKGMVRVMHVNLSSAPPKCQSCNLEKQTRTPVPKV